MMKRLFRILLTTILVYPAIALGLIVSQRPSDLPPQDGLNFDQTLTRQSETPNDPSFQHTSFTAKDGEALAMTHVRNDAAPLIVMIHGSGWHGQQFDQLAWSLRDIAEVKAVTLRGHGANPTRRGDIDYIGQFEDDLAPLLQDARDAGRKTVLLGHSSGGGLVVRFAGGEHGHLMDRAVLLSPFLKHDAPTMRDNAGGWNVVLIRRMIGLSMLNSIGITALNHLSVIQFNMPQEVLDGPQGAYATLAYSYRLNTGYAPRPAYLDDIAALPKFALVAGAADEAFFASEFEPLMSAVSDKGRYVIVPDVGHLDIVDAPETAIAIREVLSELDR